MQYIQEIYKYLKNKELNPLDPDSIGTKKNFDNTI